MPQSLSRIIIHLIFSTKRRQPWLSDPTLRSEMQGVSGDFLTVWDSRSCWWEVWRIMCTSPVIWDGRERLPT
jgi:hypothetical protein